MRHLVIVAACLCGVVGLVPGTQPLVLAAPRTAPAIGVIVHPSARVDRLDHNTLAAIFTQSMRHWDSGAPIVVFNYPARHPLRVAFDHAVLSKSPDEVALFWIGQRVRGKGSAPRTASTPQLMLRVIESLRGAIGYVPAELRSPQVLWVAAVSPDGRVTSGAGP